MNRAERRKAAKNRITHHDIKVLEKHVADRTIDYVIKRTK